MNVRQSRERLVKAAVAFVNVVDRGEAKSIVQIKRVGTRLANAVNGYEQTVKRKRSRSAR